MCIWGTETDTRPDGRVETRVLQEVWWLIKMAKFQLWGNRPLSLGNYVLLYSSQVGFNFSLLLQSDHFMTAGFFIAAAFLYYTGLLTSDS